MNKGTFIQKTDNGVFKGFWIKIGSLVFGGAYKRIRNPSKKVRATVDNKSYLFDPELSKITLGCLKEESKQKYDRDHEKIY